MRLVIVRHAEAAPGEPDATRPLTPAGREQARALGERLARDGVRPDLVITSPLLRARETAKLLAKPFGAEPVIEEALAPGATADAVRRLVSDRGDTIVLVGHQPDCSRLVAALGGEPEPPFPPAAAHAVEL